MERMKIYRPLKAPPRPESIKILSPFGEKLLMMLQENRIQDNTRHYFGNHSQTNTCRRFGDEDIMQQLERWDGDGKAMTFPSSLDSPSSIASFLKPMVAKTRVNLQMKSTPTSNSTVRPNSTDKKAGYNLLQRQPPISTASNDSTVGNSTVGNSTIGNSSDTISIYNVAHQSSSAQNQIAVKRPSIFAEELGNARKTPKFQVPLRQTQPKCTEKIITHKPKFTENITGRCFSNTNPQSRLPLPHSRKPRGIGVLQIEYGKPCPVKKTTQKKIGDFFTARSSSKNKENEFESRGNVSCNRGQNDGYESALEKKIGEKKRNFKDLFAARSLSTDRTINNEDDNDENIDCNEVQCDESDYKLPWDLERTKNRKYDHFFETLSSTTDRQNNNGLNEEQENEEDWEPKITQLRNKQGEMGRMKENLDYSQSFASFITFPDEDEGEIRVSQRFVGGNGLESGKPGENRFVSGKLGGNIFETGKPGKNRCDSGKLGRNGFESGKLDGSEFVGGNIFESGILRENETCERKKNDLESINGGDESYLVTFDDIIGAQNGEIEEEEEEEEEDNYTEDIFAADEEIKNTVKDGSKLETGIDKIRNKLMKFRRVE